MVLTTHCAWMGFNVDNLKSGWMMEMACFASNFAPASASDIFSAYQSVKEVHELSFTGRLRVRSNGCISTCNLLERTPKQTQIVETHREHLASDGHGTHQGLPVLSALLATPVLSSSPHSKERGFLKRSVQQ